MLLVDKRESYEDMKKEFTKKEVRLVSSLVKKGWSQKKIAKKLHTRKLNITRLMQKRGIGKRVASEFWGDVKAYQRMYKKSWKVSTVQVKHTPHWGGKRLAKLDPNSMEYWKEKYEIERRLTGEQMKIWKEEEYVVGSTPK